MEIILAIVSVIGWLVLLTFGGNNLVDGAVSLAKKYKISEAIIGLTIVAIGTSMPEMVVSFLAAVQGNTEIAIGNVIGSNIANVFLILGITAIIAKMHFSTIARFFDLPVMIFSTLLLLLLASDRLMDGSMRDVISRADGIIFMIFAVLYILYSLRHNNFQPDKSEEIGIIESNSKLTLSLVWGIVALFLGWKILVDGAVWLATIMGLSQSIIGLTIIAIGTSAPELVTSILAARRWSPDLAIGNVIGSNILNILIVLGVTAVIAPIPFLAASYIDALLALFAPVILLIMALFWSNNTIWRREGILMITIYMTYIGYLISKEML